MISTIRHSRGFRNIRLLAKIVGALATDVKNLLKYGTGCPTKFQLVWCNPNDIQLSTRYFIPRAAKYLTSDQELDVRKLKSEYNKFVSFADWDREIAPIDSVSIISRCKRRYGQNRTWQDVGEFTWMLKNIRQNGEQDGCFNTGDIVVRCERLDFLKTSLENGGNFLTQGSLRKLVFREMGGIGIGIGRHGELIWMKDGAHRLAIAQHLGIKKMPVSLVLVHGKAIEQNCVFKNCTFMRSKTTEMDR